MIFYLAGIVNFIGGVVFCILADANIQPWDYDPSSPEEDGRADQVDGHNDANGNLVSPILRKPLISGRSYLIDSFSLSKCIEWRVE